MSRLEEMRKELPYAIRYYPDVERLISRIVELESLNKRNASSFIRVCSEAERYKQTLENALYFAKYSRYEPDKARIMQEEIEKALKGESE